VNERTLFLAALEIADPAARAAYLDQACTGDAMLRRRLDVLLQEHARPGSLLACPPHLGVTLDEQVSERPGTVIGPYKLMEQIGEGGMGLVFVAEQQAPVRRKVALKVIKPGMDTREVIARFEAERQALALMDHPNIAKVLDAGTTESGRPYFVMELVKGIPITEYCDRQQLTPRERLGLFVGVCQAVQHAHTKGIIHRDLKPSNILVTPHDGTPVVKVIDFGVAKALGQQLTEKTIYTRFAQMIGTPLYMSPEQAEMSGLDIDTRSDIYSLGVLLYELLTGTTPFDSERLKKAAFDEIRRIIREEEPPMPSTLLSTLGATLSAVSAKRKTEPGKLSALVRGDLDWIVMKGLEKDRRRRYETASALAQDIQHHLADEPVLAGPPSTAYRLRKFVKRNRGPVLAASLVLLAGLAGIVGTTWGWLEALAQRDDALQARKDETEQRGIAVAKAAEAVTAREQSDRDKAEALSAKKRAEDNEARAEWRLYASHIGSAQRALEDHNYWLVYHYLHLCRPDFRGWERDFLYTLANQNHQTLCGHKDTVYGLAFSPDGKLLASAGRGHFDPEETYSPGEVKVWDAAGGRLLRTLTGHTGNVSSVAFSADSKQLASASFASPTGPGEVKIWDAAGGELLWSRTGRTAKDAQGPYVEWFNSVAFSPDGKRLAGASSFGTVRHWEIAGGPAMETTFVKGQRTAGLESIAFSPDGKRLASASSNRPVQVWDAVSGQLILTFQGPTGNVRNIAYSPDGKRLVASEGGDVKAKGRVKVWDAATGQKILCCEGHTADVGGVAYSPDGKRLASASMDETVKVWDAGTGQEIVTLRGHFGWVGSVAFSPDGKRLASAGADRTVKLWDPAGVQGILTLKEEQALFTPDGKLVALEGGTVKLRDADTGREVRTLFKDNLIANSPGGLDKLTISPDGRRLAGFVWSEPGQDAVKLVKLWDTASGRGLLTFTASSSGNCLAFSLDGTRLAAAGIPDGGPLVAGSETPVKGLIEIWDTANGRKIRTLKANTGDVSSVAFSPDGRRLASAGGDLIGLAGEVTLWELASGQAVLTLKGHRDLVHWVAFSPDGKRLISAGHDQTVKFWDPASGREVLTLKGHTSAVTCFALSPDGKRLASAGHDATVRLWALPGGQEVLTLKVPGVLTVLNVAFSADGKRLLGATHDREGRRENRIWDASKSMSDAVGAPRD
jgi:WD40 repeat protein/serine/threonine protein kinase